MPQRVIILGAAGRDFHNFNTYFRDHPEYEVVAFTATQIPNIDGRRYPAALAGARYPDGIPIEPEADLEHLIRDRQVDVVVFSYSDVTHDYVMHLGARAMAAGANYWLLGPRQTMLQAQTPVVAVCAARTGSGKSQTSRRVAAILEERGRRSDEILEIMTALWTGEPVSLDGVHYSFSEYTLGARPVQRPHPPIWLGGEAPAVVRRVARWGQGFFPAHKSPAECTGLYDKVQVLRQEYGRGSVEFTNAAYLYVNLAESGELALKVTKEVLLERYTYPVTHLRLGATCILGAVDDCVRLLKEYQAAGAAHIVLDPTCPKEEVLPLLERVSREILPHFK